MPALLLVAGCVHAGSVDSPGDRWQLVETQNFRIFTDAGALHYKFLATRLENVHLAISKTFFHRLETPPLDVLLVHEPMFIELIQNPDIIAWFEPTVGDNGVLVMRVGLGDEDETSAGLGVAAHIVRHGIPRAPPWMSLGLSSFLETAVVRNDGEARFGLPPVVHAVHVMEGRLMGLAELEKATWADMNGPENWRHYATAWAFVHFMAVGGTPEVRKDFFEMLEQAASGDPQQPLQLPLARYQEAFLAYALGTFGSKPSVRVFVEQLGALSPPSMKITPVAAPEMTTILKAVQAARPSADAQ